MSNSDDKKGDLPPPGLPGCPRCEWLLKRLIILEEKVSALEARLAKNSDNSHKPPSSDGYAKPEPKSLRPKSTRPSGGQAGHIGNTLSRVDTPAEIIVHLITRCPCGCGQSLHDQPVLRYESRQVFDLPTQPLIVTEHRVEVKHCPTSGRDVSADFPAGVSAPAQYGQRFNALLVYLRVQQLIPLDRIRQMCGDLFGQSISAATIQSAMTTAFNTLGYFEVRVGDLLTQALVINTDETGLRIAGKLNWLHAVSTRLLTWYGVHRKRGSEAIQYFDLLTRITGRLIHDCFISYFQLNCLHGLCNAHFLRELTFLHEVQHQAWALQMKRLLLRMHRAVLAQRQRAGPSCALQRTAWTAKYRAVLRRGFTENPPAQLPMPQPRRGRPKHTLAQNLLARLQLHEASVLAFLQDSRVPFTNNQAEQDVRMIKVQQKISGAFRTFTGAQQFARIRAYLSTTRKNGLNVFQETVAIFSGNPFMPTISA